MKMARIKVKNSSTFEDYFNMFLTACKGKGLSQKTLQTYSYHFAAISKHLSPSAPIDTLFKSDLDSMISSMRDSGLAPNSIRSYTRTLKSFFSWCNMQGITKLNIPLYKAEETVKEVYSDQELKVLLKKPNMKTCRFSEYRNWVIINLLVNNGCRASTVRYMLIKDVDFDNRVIYLRHTKNKKAQVLPLSNTLCSIFSEYLRIRGGDKDDYLFPNETSGQLTENGLRCTIADYNRSHGVTRTSIHTFRHTFARKYLVDCGGNAFTLQKLLGHSTLDMTKHYCAIFDADIVKNYDQFSPLEQLSTKRTAIRMKK